MSDQVEKLGRIKVTMMWAWSGFRVELPGPTLMFTPKLTLKFTLKFRLKFTIK